MSFYKQKRLQSLLNEANLNQAITAQGWVRTVRHSKAVSFINLNDGSNLNGLQIIVDGQQDCIQQAKQLHTGAAIEVTGTLVPSPAKGQAFELQAQSIRIHGNAPAEGYPLQKKGHTLEFLREIGHLRPRTNTFGSVFRVRNTVGHAIHQFFQDEGFIHLHSPIITGSDAEGAGEMFHVTSLDLEALPKTPAGTVDFQQDFFGKPVSLTVSGQLEGEIFAMAFSQVYTFGPTFRAENSNTSRHLAEFWMVEPEMAFADLNDNFELAERFLKHLIRVCLDQREEDLAFLQQMYDKQLITTLQQIEQAQFEKITYTEAIKLLEKSKQKFEFPVSWGMDLQSEHERWLTEKHFANPVAIVDYPKDIKAFYMRQNDDNKTVAAMDVLFPRMGEVIGGSQREERHDRLVQTIQEKGLKEQDYWWYLDLRRFGSAPHAGFGLGFERFVQFVTGMSNIRDVIAFPRVPNNALF